MQLTCPNGHMHEYKHVSGWTTAMALIDGVDPNVHVSYYTCRTCGVDFMLVEQQGYVAEVRPAQSPGAYVEPPKRVAGT